MNERKNAKKKSSNLRFELAKKSPPSIPTDTDIILKVRALLREEVVVITTAPLQHV